MSLQWETTPTPIRTTRTTPRRSGNEAQRSKSYTRDFGTGTDDLRKRSGTPQGQRSNTYNGKASNNNNNNNNSSYGNNNNHNRNHSRAGSNNSQNAWSGDPNQFGGRENARDSGHDWNRDEQKAYDEGARIAAREMQNMDINDNNFNNNNNNRNGGYGGNNNNNNNNNNRGGGGGYGNNNNNYGGGYNNNNNNRGGYGGGYNNNDRGYGGGGGGWNNRRDSPPQKESRFNTDRKMDVAYEAGYKDAMEKVKADMMRQFGRGY